MLTGSAITRALVIVVLAAGLAGLWQMLMPRTTGTHVSEPPKVDSSKRTETGRNAAPATPSASENGDPVRSVYPGPRPADPPAPRQPPVAEVAPAPSQAAPPTSQAAPPTSQAAPAPIVVPPPAAAPAPSPPPVFTPAAPSAPLPQADDAAEAPPSTGTVDLNTASVAELNGLGGGMIGKAIVARRPYASPSDLLSKRVLSRATYDRIKGQVTVR